MDTPYRPYVSPYFANGEIRFPDPATERGPALQYDGNAAYIGSAYPACGLFMAQFGNLYPPPTHPHPANTATL